MITGNVLREQWEVGQRERNEYSFQARFVSKSHMKSLILEYRVCLRLAYKEIDLPYPHLNTRKVAGEPDLGKYSIQGTPVGFIQY